MLGNDPGAFTVPDLVLFLGLVTDPSLAGVLPVEGADGMLGPAVGGMAVATVEVTALTWRAVLAAGHCSYM